MKTFKKINIIVLNVRQNVKLAFRKNQIVLRVLIILSEISPIIVNVKMDILNW
jgi:hypothetical protein